jgi:hypothetical protein
VRGSHWFVAVLLVVTTFLVAPADGAQYPGVVPAAQQGACSCQEAGTPN